MHPLANLIALIVASVPELVILIFSIEGKFFLIRLANLVSSNVGAPKLVLFLITFSIDLITEVFACPSIIGPHEPI